MFDEMPAAAQSGTPNRSPVGVARRGGSGGVPLEAMSAEVAEHRHHVRGRRDQLVRIVREHAAFLPSKDKALLETVVVNGSSVAGAAALLGISDAAGRRRVRVLIKRLASFEFQFTARHHSRWEPRESAVAQWCIIKGISIRQTAMELKLATTYVRRMRDIILARSEGAKLAISTRARTPSSIAAT
jgi:hypothetical protein